MRVGKRERQRERGQTGCDKRRAGSGCHLTAHLPSHTLTLLHSTITAAPCPCHTHPSLLPYPGVVLRPIISLPSALEFRACGSGHSVLSSSQWLTLLARLSRLNSKLPPVGLTCALCLRVGSNPFKQAISPIYHVLIQQYSP